MEYKEVLEKTRKYNRVYKKVLKLETSREYLRILESTTDK